MPADFEFDLGGMTLETRNQVAAMSKYLFGPVPSRRLGRSLGVDLVPFKTCTYDCVYCQLGRTTHKTVERGEWTPVDDILGELEERLSTRPDYITLSGSGEPTLSSRIGEVIERIKTMTDIPVAVLTNGSLLWDEEVRRPLCGADLVIPSLDAGDEATFQRVNRPVESITFELMLKGLVDFRREFRGEYWLEVLLLDGVTATPAAVEQIARCAARIEPDRVQLNTVTRPPADPGAAPVSKERLAQFATMFSPEAEVIADFRDVHQKSEFVAGRQEVFEMLRRRPCSVADVAAGLQMHHNEVVKYIGELQAEGLLGESVVAGEVLYSVTSSPGEQEASGG
jgi:wyosine [tRNA(Phe)-imidazoG37] synthetase (radical SAM superfamily)